MYAALYPEKVVTLELKESAINFDVKNEGFAFREAIEAHDPKDLVAVFGNIPALVLVGFVARTPIEYTVMNPLRLRNNLENEEFVEQAALRTWWFVSGPSMVGSVYCSGRSPTNRHSSSCVSTSDTASRPGLITSCHQSSGSSYVAGYSGNTSVSKSSLFALLRF